MKKIFLLLGLFSVVMVNAQEFPGYRSGNFTGVNGVFFNPANIAGSNYRFDINLFSIHSFVGNNQADFSLRSISSSFNGDTLKKKLFSGSNGPVSAMASVVVNGPSFMFNINEKTAIAITTRGRTMANVIDLDGKLAEQIIDDVDFSTTLPYSVSSSNDMRVAVNAWAEIGLSLGRVFMNQGSHHLKGGATIKYLGGAGNGYLNISNLNARIDDDLLGSAYLSNTTGRIQAGFGGVDIANIQASDFLKMKNPGLGFDLGMVYEYHTTPGMPYKLRAGLSILDIGSIKYKKDQLRSGDYGLDITGSERFYFSELEGKDIDQYNDVFKSKPQFFTPLGTGAADYSVSLPTTIQAELDYAFSQRFFAGLSAQLPLALVSDQVYNSRNYSSITLTPRFEGRVFGVYLPVNYNSLTDFNAGFSFRAGPLFFGSGSILTALLGSSKQADGHIGIRFGGLKKRS
jgi:hypothetical protein